ncbi:Flagellar protein FliS [compost metagenome]
MLMQGGLDRIAQAKGAIARNDIAQRGILIGKAIGIVGGLREGLDLENHAESLAELDNLYSYMSKRLVEANVQNDPEILNEVARLLITVKEGWDAIGDQSADV